MRISESGFGFKDERLNGCYLVVKSYTYIILQKGPGQAVTRLVSLQNNKKSN